MSDRPHKKSEQGAGGNRETGRATPGDWDLLDLYFREVRKVPLLSRRQERELADKIRRGDSSARDLMIRANLRLVVKIAHDYKHFGLPLADLISEGNVGLMKAVERFDPEKGGKLSTYASWWIKQRIQRALANQSKTIRLPVHVTEKLNQIRKASDRLRQRLGHEPPEEEVARRVDLSAGKVAHLKNVSSQPASLDAPAGEDGLSTIGDLIGDENAPTPAEEYAGKSLKADIRKSLDELDGREAEILRLRFGLDDGSPQTLEEIGQKFGLTRERIRQLQNIALGQIRRKLKERDRTRPDAGSRRRGWKSGLRVGG